MTRDYARPAKRASSNRQAQKKTPAKRARTRNNRSQAGTDARNIWSAPSFSAGVIFGAALVLLVSYAPGVFEDTVVAVRQQVEAPAEEIVFDFPEMLQNDTVTTDPSAYPAQFPEEDPNAPPTEYMIQAASLRAYAAAAALKEDLIGVGLAASFERVDVNKVTWYRIMVGPFASRQEANRAMTVLRRRNLGPRLIKLG